MPNKFSKAEEQKLPTYKLTSYPHPKKLSKREMSKVIPFKITLGIKNEFLRNKVVKEGVYKYGH